MSAAASAVQAYRQVGQQGLSVNRRVLLGLEGLLEYIRRARLAMEQGDLLAKAEAMDKGYRLTAHLLASVDLEHGGEIAIKLQELYRFLLQQLALANIFDDLDKLDACTPVVQDLRDAWRGLLERG